MKQFISGLAVHTFGDPKNQSIIFVHGFPYEHSMWNFQIEALKEKYFCVTYDLRGLGESTVGDGQYTLEFMVDDLFNIIAEINGMNLGASPESCSTASGGELHPTFSSAEAEREGGLKPGKPVLCGLSMGGYIALRATERNQELFKALILCDTKSEADDNTAKLKRSENLNIINTQGLIRFNDSFITNCFAEETLKEQEKLFLETLHKAHKNDPLGVKGAMLAIMSRTDTTAFLPWIEIPTLLICGAFDKLTPPPVMRAMVDKIPNSEFAAIPMAGHMAPLENPDCVNDVIVGFLKRRVS